MVFFKHNEMFLPVKRILEMQQNRGRHEGAKITRVWEDAKPEALNNIKKIKTILLETDGGEWIASSRAEVTKNELGLVIEPKEYYDIDEKEYII